MNYYERHLGDYARDTGHLSMLEHGAYSLLLDRYYATRRTAIAPMTPFHVAFAMFRFAVIFEGIAARARAGTAAGADAARVGDLSIAFARRGMEATKLSA